MQITKEILKLSFVTNQELLHMTTGSFRTPPSRHRQSPCHSHRQTFLSSHRHHITAYGLSHIQPFPHRQPSLSATRIVLPPYPAILDTCPKMVSTISLREVLGCLFILFFRVFFCIMRSGFAICTRTQFSLFPPSSICARPMLA